MLEEPLHQVMVSGINRFALRKLKESPGQRPAKWNRDYSSHSAYVKSISKNRERFRTIIGAVDHRVADPDIELIATTTPDSVTVGRRC